MTLRERFLQTMYYQHPKKIPDFEFGYWDETLPRWHSEGLPKEINDEASAYKYFGIENFAYVAANLSLNPVFESQIIREDENYLTYRGENGVTCQVTKKTAQSIPHFIDFPIKNRKDWVEYKARLSDNPEGRIPENLSELNDSLKKSDAPRAIWFGSMIGCVRDITGFENLAYLVYDDRDLIEDMVETFCRIAERCLPIILKKVEFDVANGWEDICYNSGPIISPKMFDEIVVPRYQRITKILHEHSINIIFSDCDGNVLPIIPSYLKGGINCMFPLEVNGGSDPVLIREKFGREVLLLGGVNKMVLNKGLKAIEKELLRLKPAVEEGGFIPHVDHRVPVNVSLEDYRTYLKLKREIFNI